MGYTVMQMQLFALLQSSYTVLAMADCLVRFLVNMSAFPVGIYIFGRMIRSAISLHEICTLLAIAGFANAFLLLTFIWPQYPPVFQLVLGCYRLISHLVGLQGIVLYLFERVCIAHAAGILLMPFFAQPFTAIQ